LTAGDRAVLVYPPSMDFVRALLGCLIAGVVPVPAYPPEPFKRDQGGAALGAIVASSGARALLTNGAYDRARTLGVLKDRLGGHGRGLPGVPWRRTDGRPPAAVDPLTWHVPSGPDEPALLQYTSGSTAAPKGVVITHGNLAHEVAANARDLGLGEGARRLLGAAVPQQLSRSCLVRNRSSRRDHRNNARGAVRPAGTVLRQHGADGQHRSRCPVQDAVGAASLPITARPDSANWPGASRSAIGRMRCSCRVISASR
jgi:acyl-CoA synthetase (AMP-forming)/AMP-acid ligase II